MIAFAGDKELRSLLVGDLGRLQPRVAPWGPAQDSHIWSVDNFSFDIVGLHLVSPQTSACLAPMSSRTIGTEATSSQAGT